MKFSIGQRVRTTAGAPPAPGFEGEWSAPAGTLGTIESDHTEHPGGGYGVLLDGDPYKLPAHYDANELEAAE